LPRLRRFWNMPPDPLIPGISGYARQDFSQIGDIAQGYDAYVSAVFQVKGFNRYGHVWLRDLGKYC
jgi:hypothetical protein